MSRAVLDASAVLALLLEEPGADLVRAWVPDVLISAVNVSEAGAKFFDRGVEALIFRRAVATLGAQIVPFDEEAAYAAASLRQATRRLGLSLGDRACLSLGVMRRLPVITADRAWRNVEIGADVRVIREG